MSDHAFIRPGQVAPHLPAPDACMRCGRTEVGHDSSDSQAARDAAVAVLADFARYAGGKAINAGGIFDWQTAAQRLAAVLGSVLDHLAAVRAAPSLVLSESNEAILGQALADALAYRTPQGPCPDCDVHPAGLCEDHAADLDKTDAYLDLARQLGIGVQR